MNDMNIARLRFKNTFQQCKLMEDRGRADAMANSLKNHHSVGFWKKSSNLIETLSLFLEKLMIALVKSLLLQCRKNVILNF